MNFSKLSTVFQSPLDHPFAQAPLQNFQPPEQRKQMGWLQLSSFGGRLFWMILLSTLAGLGGMAFCFSEMLKHQAEEQVSSSLDGKVNAIAAVTETAETLAYGLGISATTLHERGAQYPDTYREIVLQLFERRPDFVVGLGLGQSENGIIVEQPWLFPYYSVIPSQEDTSFEQDAIRYEDFADDTGEFYPESERYQDYFLPQTSLWTEPYEGPSGCLLTYYLPMFGHEGGWLGTILVDINSKHLSNLLDESVFRQAGHFVLLTRSGNVIADPANPENRLRTYQDIADLEPLWEQVDIDGTGFLRGNTGYWSYATVPGQEWLLFGYVPYGAVYDRILGITAVTTAGVMGVLTVILFLAVRKLNRRLKPILLQCNQMSPRDHNLLAHWQQQDELDQLSLAFFNILEQFNAHEETIRRCEQALSQESRHTDQIIEQFLEFTTRIDEEANDQQVLIQRAQQLIADKDYQSLDIQLDALLTMGRALDGDLKRLPSDVDPVSLLADLEQGMDTLAVAIDRAQDLPDRHQLQALIARLVMDVASLKVYNQRQPSLKKLQYQTSNIAQAGQAAMDNSQSMVALVQSITEGLVKIKAISTALNGQVKFVSDMIWLDLEQRKAFNANDELAAIKD